MAIGTIAAQDWAGSFEPYTVQHFVCVLVCVQLMVGVAMLGLRLRGKESGERLRLAVAWAGIAYWIGSNAWWLSPANYRFEQSLPIQVCDLAGLIGPLALLTGKRWLRAILYFWGLSLSIQGFVQPVLTKGAGYAEFWLFWANHTVIVGTALYDVVAMGFRPRWRDYVLAVGASAAYTAVIFPFDAYFRVNYGYIGPTDPVEHHETLVDKMGPWPMRVIPIFALGMWAMFMTWWPWALIAKRRGVGRGGA